MSLIRSLLLEGPEQISLPPGPSASAPSTGTPMSQTDFVPPAMSQGGLPGMGGMPSMPSGQAVASTIQKEVMNKELVLAITGELKSVLNAFEKKFESEDMTVDVGSVYLKSFLDTLAFNADKIAALMGVEPAQQEQSEPLAQAAPEEPVAEPVTPEAAPELTKEPESEESPLPGENPYADFTSPEGEAPAGSNFTSPTEAI